MPETFDVVFRGGGIKGATFVGALEILHSHGHCIRRRIGTSVGGLFAAFHACGFTVQEMDEELRKTTREGRPVFSSFLNPAGDREGLAGNVVRLAGSAIDRAASYLPDASAEQTKGLGARTLGLALDAAACSDQPVRDWIAARLESRGITPIITLADLHAKLNRKSHSQLTLVAADIVGKECLLLNERTAPKLPLIEAVRMSMGIPFVWPVVEWKEEWGSYRRSPNNEADLRGHLIVDGGLISNFPIRYLLEPRHCAETGLLGPLPGGPARPLGLFLSENDPVPDFPQQERRPLAGFLPMFRVGSLLLDTMLDAADADVLRNLIPVKEELKILCKIGTRGYSALEFDLPYEPPLNGRGLKQLVNSGRDAMTRFLENPK